MVQSISLSTGAEASSPVGCAEFCPGKQPEQFEFVFDSPNRKRLARSKTIELSCDLWFTWPVICFLG